ncbi:unnamed protein product [Dicrocoelium dendriticum]|nr:unnamed protein product [Dicrocoelium dendriticum]
MDPARYFSSPTAGTKFSAVDFIRQPVVILQLVGLVFATIVFGCVSNGCRTPDHVCVYHGEGSACSYAVVTGVLAFLVLIAFLVCSGTFNSISNIKKRRQIVIAELALSGLWTFLWFVSFCLLTNKWTTTTEDWLERHKVESWQRNNARSAIVFSMASIGVWAGLTFFALQRFRLGQVQLGAEEQGTGIQGTPGGDTAGMPESGYTDIPEQGSQQPFSSGKTQQQSIGGGQYYAANY